MPMDVKKLLSELLQVSEIKRDSNEYRFKVHGILPKRDFGRIVKTAKKHGLKFKHLTSDDGIILVFEEVET